MGMHGESEAYNMWLQFKPTLTDGVLFVWVIMFASILWVSIRHSQKEINENRAERKEQIEDIKTLVLVNITDIKTSFADHIRAMKEVVGSLEEEKRLIGEHLIRHEAIGSDISRMCSIIEDHESRLRVMEKWDHVERRKAN